MKQKDVEYPKQMIPFFIGCLYHTSWQTGDKNFILLKIEGYKATLRCYRTKKENSPFVTDWVWNLEFSNVTQSIERLDAITPENTKYVKCTPKSRKIVPKKMVKNLTRIVIS